MSVDPLNPTTNGTLTANGEHAVRTTDTSPPSGRDAHGRFTKNKPGGPGNSFARQTAAMHRALCAVVREEDIQAIALKLKELALAGNLAAIKLLFSYVIGRPQAATNPDTLDLQEWSQLRQAPAMLEEMPKVTQCLTPEHACFLARNTQPLVSEEILTQIETEIQIQIEKEARARERQQAKRDHKTPRTETPTAPRQTEPKPVQPQQKPPSGNGSNGSVETRQPSPIGGNGPERFASLTPEEILEVIRQERWCIESAWVDGRAPGHAAPEKHAATVTKPG